MAEGIIFGGYLLTESEFKLILKEWYDVKKKDFLLDLELKIIQPISAMIELDSRVNSKGIEVPKVKKIAGQYQAQKIYSAWESLSEEYFGNGKVSLIAAVNFEGKGRKWTTTIDEQSVMTKAGISIRKKGFSSLNRQMEDVGGIYAADAIQEFLNDHYQDLLTTLSSYQLNRSEAKSMHQLLEDRRSRLNNVDFHFTGSTYDKIIFSSQQNSEGKKLDAYMNHIGSYNPQLFGLMKTARVNSKALDNIILNGHGGFDGIFTDSGKVQSWLLDSLNSASWLSGGDIVVVNEQGAVIYNIQLKSTGKGKTFDLASSFLLNFAKEMRDIINSPEASAEKLADLMYKRLKTSSANEFTRSESFIESEAYNFIKRNLGLK